MSSNKPRVGIDLVYDAHSVPVRLQMIVCTCEVTDTPGWQFEDADKPLTCRKCHKMPRYLVRLCCGCKQLFAKDFRHTLFTSEYPLCWDCLQDIKFEHLVALDELRPIGFHDKRNVPPVFAKKLAAFDNPELDLETLLKYP